MRNRQTTLTLSRLLDTRNLVPPQSGLAKSVLDQFPGLRTGPKRGQGLEFDDLRQYQAGDDIRHIDWNVTARSGEPHTRLYREEREHTTTAIVDLRPSMFTGSNVLKAVRAGELAATALWQAMRQGDRCSAVVFSSLGVRATRPVSSDKGVLNACELIASEFELARSACEKIPDVSAPDTEPELDYLYEWLNLAGRRTGIKLLFSSFDHTAESRWPGMLKAAGVRQKLVGMALVDKLESDGLPPGTYHYKRGTQNYTATSRAVLNSASAKQLGAELARSLQSLRHLFSAAHVPLIELGNDCSNAQMLAGLAHRQII